MLTVICGEDSATARQALLKLKESYQKKGFTIQQVGINELTQIYNNNASVVDLFGQESVYFVDKVSSKYKGREKTPFKETIQEISKHKTIHVVDWEDGKSAYDISGLKRIASDFQEFKAAKSIFQLVESCYPGNLKEFLHSVHTVNKTQDDVFIFIMLSRQIRSLILAKENALDAKTNPWQKRNLMTQAKLWSIDKLVGFYEGLSRIDIALKTSSTPFELKKSLDILACYYL